MTLYKLRLDVRSSQSSVSFRVGYCMDGLKVHKKCAEIPQGRLKIRLKYVEIPGEGDQKMDVLNRGGGVRISTTSHFEKLAKSQNTRPLVILHHAATISLDTRIRGPSLSKENCQRKTSID
jgi:hypothetical protein